MIVVIIFCLTPDRISLPDFLVSSSGALEAEEISVYDAADGNYYVFLPSYAELEQVEIAVEKENYFSLDGKALSDGMTCDSYELEMPYNFAIDGQQAGTLWFYQSANIATMYIDTSSGSMDAIHADRNKEHAESAAVMLYTDVGEVDCEMVASISGRGNSTWKSEKRPYALELNTARDLLGMGAASNWALLANASDKTNLNNKLALDLACRVGMEWAPESRFVDVYLNGDYSGLYLLTEKLEVHQNRLNLDAGDFLFRIDLNRRWDRLRNPFLTEAGRAVGINYPKILSEAEVTEAESLVNQMEQILSSGADLQKEPIIDLDSWARRYIVDEISANVDADQASSYFYYSNGVFYGGPVWDYDLGFGNDWRNQNPCSFVARNYHRSDTFFSPYHSWLYANESFRNRMKEIYRTEFVPVLQEMLNGGIDSLGSQISQAAELNQIRWYDMLENGGDLFPRPLSSPEALKEYLSRRVAFLDRAWLMDVEYCSVQFENSPGAAYRNVAVEKGCLLDPAYVDLENVVWYDVKTGEPFDFSQPILSDMIFATQDALGVTESETSEEDDPEAEIPSGPLTRDYIAFLCNGVLLLLFVGFGVLDRIRRYKERRTADEGKSTEVSS